MRLGYMWRVLILEHWCKFLEGDKLTIWGTDPSKRVRRGSQLNMTDSPRSYHECMCMGGGRIISSTWRADGQWIGRRAASTRNQYWKQCKNSEEQFEINLSQTVEVASPLVNHPLFVVQSKLIMCTLAQMLLIVIIHIVWCSMSG